MKFKINRLNLNLVLASSFLAANIPAFTVTGDTDRPIYIESGQQSLDMQGNVVTFTGNVIVTQGAIKISADKVVVIHPDGEQSKEVIDDYGKPAAFYQMQGNDKPIEGHTSQMCYELAKDFIILTGNAYLQRVGSNIKGDKIAYLVKEQKMQAFDDKDRCMTTVLVPSQLQDKNNRGQALAQRKGN